MGPEMSGKIMLMVNEEEQGQQQESVADAIVGSFPQIRVIRTSAKEGSLLVGVDCPGNGPSDPATGVRSGHHYIFVNDGVVLGTWNAMEEGAEGERELRRRLALFAHAPHLLEEYDKGNLKGGGDAERSPQQERSAYRIFVAGDRSQVGKSTVCLGILGSLLSLGYTADDLAYIKPATQCEQPQLVTSWCNQIGIACQGIGPIVFYKGFTRAFLDGVAGTSEGLLSDVRKAVEKIALGKKIVVIDGVGYPAVGSVCGVSNAAVARTLGAPVLIVGKSGVGDAVDSYNLNSSYFESHGVRILGAVFNRLPLSGFYSLEKCEAAVRKYFSNNGKRDPYGFLPEVTDVKANVIITNVFSHMDVPRLLLDMQSTPSPSAQPIAAAIPSSGALKRTREEIEAEAEASGAAGG